MYTGQSIEASERERLYIEQKDSREKKYFVIMVIIKKH